MDLKVDDPHALLKDHLALRAEYIQMKECVQTVEERIQTVNSQKEQMSQQLDSMHFQLNHKIKECDDLRNHLRNAPEVSTLENQLREESEMKAQLKQELEDQQRIRQRNKELGRELAALRADKDEELAKYRKVADMNALEADATITSLTQTVQDLQQRLERRTDVNTLKSLEREKSELQNRLKLFQDEATKQRETSERLAELERKATNRLRDAEMQSKCAAAELSRMSELARSLKEVNLQASLDLERLHSEKSKVEGERNDTQRKVDEFHLTLKSVRNEVKQACREREMHLEREKAALELVVADQAKRCDHLEQQLLRRANEASESDRAAQAKLQHQRDDEEEKLNSLKREQNRLAMEKEIAENRHSQQVNTLKEEVDAQKREISRVLAERQEQETLRLNAESERQHLQQQLGWVQEERNNAMKELQDREAHVAELQTQLEAALELRMDNNRLRLRIEFLERERNDLEEEREQLSTDLATRITRLQRSTLEERRMQMEQLEGYRRDLKKCRQQAEKKNTKLAAQLHKSDQQREELRKELDKKHQDVISLRRQLDGVATVQDGCPGRAPDLTSLFAAATHQPENEGVIGPDCAFSFPYTPAGLGTPSAGGGGVPPLWDVPLPHTDSNPLGFTSAFDGFNPTIL